MPLAAKTDSIVMVPDNLSGDNLDEYFRQLGDLLKKKPGEVVLDCSQLQRATSAHINVLWETRQNCDEAKLPMRLTSISKGLFRVLKILDLHELFLVRECDDTGESKLETIRLININGDPFSISFIASDPGVQDAFDKFKSFLAELGLQEILILELETVFYEIAKNIQLHSNLNDMDEIQFQATPLRDKMALQFTYQGVEFDPTANVDDIDPLTAIRKRQKRGYGLIMIHKMTDNISYRRLDNNLNVLGVEKYWGGTDD